MIDNIVWGLSYVGSLFLIVVVWFSTIKDNKKCIEALNEDLNEALQEKSDYRASYLSREATIGKLSNELEFTKEELVETANSESKRTSKVLELQSDLELLTRDFVDLSNAHKGITGQEYKSDVITKRTLVNPNPAPVPVYPPVNPNVDIATMIREEIYNVLNTPDNENSVVKNAIAKSMQEKEKNKQPKANKKINSTGVETR